MRFISRLIRGFRAYAHIKQEQDMADEATVSTEETPVAEVDPSVETVTVEATPVEPAPVEVPPPRHIADVIVDLEKAKADFVAAVEQSKIGQSAVKDAHALVSTLTAEFHAAATVFDGTIQAVVSDAESAFDWIKEHL